MKIYWTDESLTELEAIVVYIAKDNPSASLAVADMIFDQVETVLPNNPKVGRPGRVDSTRELVVHASCIIVYRINTTTIDILTVRHTARLCPKEF